MTGVKAVIFDLGNVLIELHYDRSLNMLKELTDRGEAELNEMLVTAPLLQQFEVGNITESEFKDSFRDHMKIDLSSDRFDKIWNALLGNITSERIQRVRALKSMYKTFVLSNTNAIHERCFNAKLKSAHGFDEIGDLVDKAYFSHVIGLRKPDSSIYEFVLAQENLLPAEVLFIDDREDNILSASRLGINTYLNVNVDDWLRHPLLSVN